MGKSLFRGFHKKQWAGQDKWAYLAGLNRCSGLWGLRSVSSCLVPSPVVIRAEKEWPIFCKNSVKEVVEGGLWIGQFAQERQAPCKGPTLGSAWPQDINRSKKWKIKRCDQ